MNIYFAAVFTDLVRHSVAWARMPRDNITHVIAEHRYLSQSLASQYGRRHENFTGDGHLYLFESADVAVHFGLKLIAYWKQRRRSLVAASNAQDMPMRVGCHFGECFRMAGEDAWIGRAINIAKRVESNAEADSLFVTQTILELIDLPVYQFAEAGFFELRGDFLPQRQLYRVLSIDSLALSARSEEAMTAEDWFLKGVSVANQSTAGVDEELRCYNRAVQLRASYPEAHNNLGVLYKAIGNPVLADEHYKEALRHWPQYPEAHYNYAILLEELGEHVEAAAHYREAIRSRPDYVDAWLRYGGFLEATGNRFEAERHFQEALRLRPGFAEAHNNYGVFLERKGDTASAQSHYEEALRLKPDYAAAHYNLASSLELCDPSLAEDHYRAAIFADPDYAEAHNNLAVLLHEAGDLAAAEEHYTNALRLRPDDQQTNYNLGLLEQAKGDNDRAEMFFKRAREANAQQ
ncbi:tetratricopeptide (TPR) repeat protein [Rhizobium mesoamericanum]|uniref:tetratricopeptide repeat protein n=1 Tax=Rhizobium mesoamericanum TaxID=1079800 RepID=UPI002786C3C5|nr:tetratricopeptide repeat protein [Rhizobium mesoamericanum]MDQ0561992.1 tetratricopeptide (TPR) repeat protein [Rhizobium mesoamericanum]